MTTSSLSGRKIGSCKGVKYLEFSEKLKELRKNRGLTQEELANDLYVSRTAISKWESGKGYPNIDSLKVISKYFSVSLDELLSNEELLDVAENEQKVKEQKNRDIIYGTLDCSLIMFFFLPFFGQNINGVIQEVSLLNLIEVNSYIKVPYIIGIVAIVVLGIFTLALQNCNKVIWVKNNSKLSLILSTVLAFFFIMSTQPYAAGFTLLFLIIKAIMLIKWE